MAMFNSELLVYQRELPKVGFVMDIPKIGL